MNEWLENSLDSFYEEGECASGTFDVYIGTLLGVGIGVLIGLILSLLYLAIVYLYVVLPLMTVGLFANIVELMSVSVTSFACLGALWAGRVAYKKQIAADN